MSYFTSKHPGLFLYIFLIIASSLSLMAYANAPAILTPLIGGLSALWGLFLFMRILALYEVSELAPPAGSTGPSKSGNNGAQALAYDLTKRMGDQNHIKRGLLALKCMNIRTLLWVILGFSYIAAYFYVGTQDINLADHIQNFCLLFMIGAAFWAGQSYAYSDHAAQWICTLVGGVFLFQAMALFPHHSAIDVPHIISSLEQSPSTIALAVLMIYSAATLLFASLTRRQSALYALTGLSFLLFMAFTYVTLNQDTMNTAAFWISGWSLVSVFWVRAYAKIRKTYVLYQC